ncbi:LuxR C-terminal-related transcriptional regulator [Pedobacter duraquae]|uniref:Regulatory LuxR family protein n=1 Tax=Pedobacter duraquae TaxID=425511 RepID=A0A4R6IE62_9SPHI|nr:helix-turn-helix transcriptional regulator [Pedobacter duraquae]TDO20322.1 regulatory LuxR family protein [Pedobacter duraquae]
MLKKYSTTEENILLASQLYQLDNQQTNNVHLIETLGDYLPGLLLINDMANMENIYMNNTGCQFLNQSRKEINELGSAYFKSDSFCKDEMDWIAKDFTALAKRNDDAEVRGFYQKARRNKNAEWTRYYLSGKILKGCPGCFVYIGVEIARQQNLISNINKQFDISPITPVSFQRFSTLTKREKEILFLIADGHANKQISDRLFISVFTVETHRKNINKKLGTKKLSELLRTSDLFNP